MKYSIDFYFSGKGIAIVEAKSEKEARKKFNNGDVLSQDDWGDDYEIESVEKIGREKK